MQSKIIAFIVLLVFLQACQSQGQITKLRPEEFKELISNENVFVIDTHIPEQEHIEGTDAFIPFDKIADNINKLPADKTTSIAVYCRSGKMSEEAAKTLLSMGYKKIYDLEGGKNAYTEIYGGETK